MIRRRRTSVTPSPSLTAEAPFPGIPLYKDDVPLETPGRKEPKKGKKKEKDTKEKKKKDKKKDKKKPQQPDKEGDKENKEIKSPPPRGKEQLPKDVKELRILDDRRKRFMQLKDYQLKDLREEGDDVLEVLLSSNKFSQLNSTITASPPHSNLAPSSGEAGPAPNSLESGSASDKDSDEEADNVTEEEQEELEKALGVIFPTPSRLDLSAVAQSKSCLGTYLLGRWRKHTTMAQ